MLCYCDIMQHCNGDRAACLGGCFRGFVFFVAFFFLKSDSRMSIFSHVDHCHVLEQNMAYFTVNFIAGVKTKVMGFTHLSGLPDFKGA